MNDSIKYDEILINIGLILEIVESIKTLEIIYITQSWFVVRSLEKHLNYIDFF